MNEPPIALRNIDGLQTGICVLGEGTPVLALHGWGGSLHSFWPAAQALAPRGYQIHLLDLPGFGQSALPPQTWGVADYVAFVLAYLDTAGISRAHLIGHSFGGRIALMLAAEHPERVDRVVLASAAGLRGPLSMRHRLRQLGTRTARRALECLHWDSLRARLQAWYNGRFASDDYRNAGPLRETFLRVIEQDLSDYAARVQAATILIWGDQDTDTPLWQGRRLEQLIPDAGLIVFQGAGHFAYLDRLADFVRITEHFFSNRS